MSLLDRLSRARTPDIDLHVVNCRRVQTLAVAAHNQLRGQAVRDRVDQWQCVDDVPDTNGKILVSRDHPKTVGSQLKEIDRIGTEIKC